MPGIIRWHVGQLQQVVVQRQSTQALLAALLGCRLTDTAWCASTRPWCGRLSSRGAATWLGHWRSATGRRASPHGGARSGIVAQLAAVATLALRLAFSIELENGAVHSWCRSSVAQGSCGRVGESRDSQPSGHLAFTALWRHKQEDASRLEEWARKGQTIGNCALRRAPRDVSYPQYSPLRRLHHARHLVRLRCRRLHRWTGRRNFPRPRRRQRRSAAALWPVAELPTVSGALVRLCVH